MSRRDFVPMTRSSPEGSTLLGCCSTLVSSSVSVSLGSSICCRVETFLGVVMGVTCWGASTSTMTRRRLGCILTSHSHSSRSRLLRAEV